MTSTVYKDIKIKNCSIKNVPHIEIKGTEGPILLRTLRTEKRIAQTYQYMNAQSLTEIDYRGWYNMKDEETDEDEWFK